MYRLLAVLLLVAGCSSNVSPPLVVQDPVTPVPSVPTPPLPPPDVPQLHKTGYIKTSSGHDLFKGAAFVNADRNQSIPYRFSWNDVGLKTPVRDQGQCGSCWAFSTVQCLEGALKIFKNDLLDLSEQEVISCNKETMMCDGGWFAGDYLVKNGVASESDYPYTASSSRCKSGSKRAAYASAAANIGASDRSPTVEELKLAILQFGVISVDVAATSSWDSYHGGLKKDCHGREVNHMVNIVGWEKDGWIMKNSWGEDWGDKGYALMPFGCDSIADSASYVILK